MTPHIKLHDALLCATCDSIVEAPAERCPSCTCTQFLVLSVLVKPSLLREEIDVVRAMGRRVS